MLGIPASLRVVRDGAECLDYFFHRGAYADPRTSPRPSLLLTDVELPKINGWDVLQQARSSLDLNLLPIIILSGGLTAEDIEQAYRLGADAVFTKPAGQAELTVLVRSIVMYWNAAHRPPSRQ